MTETEDGAREVATLWGTNTVRIEYRASNDAWALRVCCSANDRPVQGWRARSYYTVGTARTLHGAVKLALRGPPRL